MRHNWMAWIAVITAYGLAFSANVGDFAWSYEAGCIQKILSAFYIIVCGWFGVCGREKAQLYGFCIVGGLTALGGIFGLLARTFGSGLFTALGLVTAGLTVTPLYGLLSLLGDYDLFYLSAAVLGLVWLGVGLWLKHRNGR